MQPIASPITQSGQSAAIVSGTGQVPRGGQRETFTLEELGVVLSHYDIGVIDSVVEFPRGSRKAPRVKRRAAGSPRSSISIHAAAALSRSTCGLRGAR